MKVCAPGCTWVDRGPPYDSPHSLHCPNYTPPKPFEMLRAFGRKISTASSAAKERATGAALAALAAEADRVTSRMQSEMHGELDERRKTIAFLRARGHEDLARAIAHEEHWRVSPSTEPAK